MVDTPKLKKWLDRANLIAQQNKFDCAAALDLAREIRIERIYGVSWQATQTYIVIDKVSRRGLDDPQKALSAFDAMRKALADRIDGES